MVLSEMILYMTDSDIIAIRGGRCINKINLTRSKRRVITMGLRGPVDLL